MTIQIKPFLIVFPRILAHFRQWFKFARLRSEFKRSGVHVLRHTFGAQLAQKGVDTAVIRDLLGHHSVTLTEKYYAHLAPSSLTSAVKRLHPENQLPKTLPKSKLHHFRASKIAKPKSR